MSHIVFKPLTIVLFLSFINFPSSLKAKLPKGCRRLRNGRISCRIHSRKRRKFKRPRFTRTFKFSYSKLRKYKRPLSVGAPWSGLLYRGRKMPFQGKGYIVVSRTRKRRRYYGLPALVGLVQRAAASVAKMYPGSMLTVADMSAANGGFVFGHRSHQSGRDIDLGFYVIDFKRRYKVFKSSFISFDKFARGVGIYKNVLFDLERNWALIESLLSDKRTKVIRIFVSSPLKDMLLSYAVAVGKSKKMIHKADVILQPFPHHDDHFHVRIACPANQPFCR